MKRSRIAALVAIGAALLGTALLQSRSRRSPSAGRLPPRRRRSGRTTSTAPPVRPPTRPSGATTSAAAAGATTSGSTTPTAPATPRSTATATWSSPPAGRTPATTSASTAPASTPRPGCSPRQTFTQTYGRFEARMKIPRGTGHLAGVLDARHGRQLAERAARSTSWRTSAASRPPCTAPSTAPATPAPAASAPAYNHPSGWRSPTTSTPSRSTGRRTRSPGTSTATQYQRRTPADLGGNRWVFDHPFFMIMNVAVGGYWPGYPDGTTLFPQTMTVDYVRVSTPRQQPAGRLRRSPGWPASASTWPAPTPPTARRCSSTTATAPPPSSGRAPATARSAPWASASTWRTPRPPTAPESSSATCNGTAAQQWTYTLRTTS